MPAVVAGADALRAHIEKARVRIEEVRRAGAKEPPRNPDHPDVAGPPQRADQLLPFLLVRTFPADIGARPIDPETSPTAYRSPDILLLEPLPAGAAAEPIVRGRGEFDQAFRSRIRGHPVVDHTYDIWVHVWNLGRSAAYGVRVRAWAQGRTESPPGSTFIGGQRIDLGDRSSDHSHRVVKLGQLLLTNEFTGLWANAESITDVSLGTSAEALTIPNPYGAANRWDDAFHDRHTAFFDVWLGQPSNYPAPPPPPIP